MSEIISDLKDILVAAVSMAIVTLVGVLWERFKALLNAKISLAKTQENSVLMQELLDHVHNVCESTTLNFDPVVEKIKVLASDGKLTPDEIQEIQEASREQAVKGVKDLFSAEKLVKIGLSSGALDDLIARELEAAVQKHHPVVISKE